MARDLPEVVGALGDLPGCTFLTDDDVSAVVVAVAPAPEPGEGAQPRAGTVDASALYHVDLGEMAERHGLEGAAGDAAVVDLPRPHRGASESFPWADLPRRIVLLGVGDGSTADLRRAGAALARRTAGLERVVSVATAGAPADGVRAFAEGYLLAAYRPERWSGSPDSRPAPAEQLVLLDPASDAEPALVPARRAARATWLARDLTATPSSVKDPAWLADRARTLASAAGLDVRVLGPRELEGQGFGGILAVGGGSSRPPRLVVVSHEPDAAAGEAPRHVVVVGKGITFDTGGLSLKPRAAMAPMKTDMAGAAVALAAVLGAAEAGSPLRVTALLPLAENHLGASSYRPGDVLRLHGGTTVEVANTDAEGRLVLADALDHAVRELAPDVLVDVATLTGAAAVGLGRGHAALYATDEALARTVEAAAARTGEAVWRMPLVADYAEALASDVAALRNVPARPPGGGSITAALFLREFTGGLPWVHLDIAGPARSSGNRHEVVEGATGFGARLLLEVLDLLS
ncbi:leucyl aminopeptidase family protein [Luteimicrobium sp. DT211]|uniref:leucyl aminopeptidase family protein n=1 Tax=Luteimicrobium sp. DT211 TaxID=3393412 RepID=UPI003CEC4D15